MKIGIYDPYLDTMSGGERYMLSIARCLQNTHQVSLFWDPTHEEEIRTEAKRRFAMELPNVTFVPSFFSPHISLLERLRKSKEYDLIVVLSDGSIPFVSCPLLLHFQTPLEWVSVNPLLNFLKFRKVKRTIVNSEYTKKFIDAKFHVNSTVLYPPVDLPESQHSEKEKVIVNVGRYGIRNAGSSFKKQEELRDAFIKLVGIEKNDWKMVFIMTASDTEEEVVASFKESVKDYPIEVLVNPDLSTVKRYYRKASIYWHGAGFGENLRKHPDRAEHFGITTVEAMHFGAVPIVINAGGQPEIVTENETGFLWKTTEELLEKTRIVMENKELRKRISENAKKRAEYFSTQRFCEELLSII